MNDIKAIKHLMKAYKEVFDEDYPEEYLAGSPLRIIQNICYDIGDRIK